MGTFNIGFVIFPNLTQLDFTGPLQVLARLPGGQTHIAAKTRDIALDPSQRRHLIHQAIIARAAIGRLAAQFGMREEAQRPHTIGDIDPDNASTRQRFARIIRHAGRADVKAPAIDPHDNRQMLGPARRRPDVEVEAVFAGRLIAEIMVHGAPAQGLQTHRRKTIGVIHPLPRRHRLRRAPAQIAQRRRGKGHAQPASDAAAQRLTIDHAAIDVDGRGGLCGQRGGGERRSRQKC